MNEIFEKIRIVTNNRVNVSTEQVESLPNKALQIAKSKKNTDSIEFEYAGYTWTFWYDKSNDGIEFHQIRVGDYTKMLAWEIKL